MAHMSMAGKPNGVRIGSSDVLIPGLSYTAFHNTDNTYGIALSNRNANDIKVTVDDGTNQFDITIPANGIASASWGGE